MTTFHISLAGQTIAVQAQHDFARRFCRDYLTDDPAVVMQASASPEDIRRDMEATSSCSPSYGEILSIYRSIAEQLPRFDTFLVHGAAISYGEKAYLFTAPSGTGKSTHIRLWKRYLGDRIDIVNGDKPLLRLKNGRVDVCSTPWAGKEQWQKNRIVPLGGICLLHRGTENRISSVAPGNYLDELMHQVYLPTRPDTMVMTLHLLDEVLRQTPLYLLECDISEQAVRTSFEALTGEPYMGGTESAL